MLNRQTSFANGRFASGTDCDVTRKMAACATGAPVREKVMTSRVEGKVQR